MEETPPERRRPASESIPLSSGPLRIRARLASALPQNGWDLGFAALVLAFVTTVSGVSAARFLAFDTRGYDLGLYAQSYLVVAHFQAPPFFPHISPIVWLFAPLLLWFPSPSTLLVVQAASLGGSGFVVHWLARDAIKSERSSFLIGGAYLIGFLPISIAWFDFHIEAMLPLFVLAMLYARRRSHFPGFVAATLLSLLTIETVLPLIAAFAVLMLLSSRFGRHSSRSERRRDFRFGLTAASAAVTWGSVLLAAYLSVPSLRNAASLLFGGPIGFSALGNPSVWSIPYFLVTHPAVALSELSVDAGSKLLYLTLLLGAFGFLSVFGDKVELLPAGVWILFAFLSDHEPFYTFGDHYAAYVLPFVAAAAISGIGLRSQSSRLPILRATAAGRPGIRARAIHLVLRIPVVSVVLVGALVTSALAYPLLSAPLGGETGNIYGLPTFTQHDAVLHEILGFVPPGGSVLTTNAIFSMLSTDRHALLAPISSVAVSNGTLGQVVQTQTSRSDYVLLDFQADWPNGALVQDLANLRSYHVWASGDGVRLLARVSTSPLVSVAPEIYGFPSDSFTPGLAQPSVDTNGVSALIYPAHVTRQIGGLWGGPFSQVLAPGTYRAEIELRLDSPIAQPAFSLAVEEVPLILEESGVSVGNGINLVTYSFFPDSNHISVLNQTSVMARAGTTSITSTLDFPWNALGELDVVGTNPNANVTIELTGATVSGLGASV